MVPVRAVTLDLFGTLVDFSVQRDEPPLVQELLGPAARTVDPHDVLETWMRASLDERAKTPFRRVRETLVHGAHHAAYTHQLDIDPTRWADELEALWVSRPLFTDVPAALDRLEAAGVPWAIVTNLDRHVLEAVLQGTGLAKRDPVAVTSEHARAYKPHPRPFRMALEALDTQPGQAVHLGNRASEDRAGAHAAGMWCVIVDPEAPERLLAAVEALLAGHSPKSA